jgi:aldose 1-epimerase
MMPSIHEIARGSALALVLTGALPVSAERPQIDDYGTLPDGRTVQRITLRNAHGMQVRILSLGGIITEIAVPDRAGKIANVVLTKPDLAAYASGANFSSLLGRYANRISGGGFTLDGKRYDLAGATANGMVLHGGPNSFSQQIWEARPFGKAHGPSGVILRHVSPDGTNGFPGNLTVTVRYSLTDDDTLRLDYGAVTDKPTVLNLSHHVYFNLAGGASAIADDQCVQILADHYAAAKGQAMTGETPSVDGTPFDLRQPTRLGDRVNKGYPQLPRGFDTPFLVRRQGKALVPIARSWDPVSGRTLELRTNEVSVQFFTPGGNPGAPRPPAPAVALPATPPVSPHVAGYAIETEHLPESPNYSGFPTTVLRPGRTFHSATSWHFGTYDPAKGVCAR